MINQKIEEHLKIAREARLPNERFLWQIWFKSKTSKSNIRQIFLIPTIGSSNGIATRIMKSRHVYNMIATRIMFEDEEKEALSWNLYRYTYHKYLTWEGLIEDELATLKWVAEHGKDPIIKSHLDGIQTKWINALQRFAEDWQYTTREAEKLEQKQND